MNSCVRVLLPFIVVIATTVAARAEFSVTAGAGVASLDLGAPPNFSFIAATSTKERVAFYRIGGEWRNTRGFGACLDFSDYQTARKSYLHDYSQAIPLLVPNNLLDLSLQATRLGLFYDFSVSRRFLLRPTAGIVWSRMNAHWTGGQTGPARIADDTLGGHAGLTAIYRLREQMTARLGVESLWVKNKPYGSGANLTSLQSVLSLAYNF